MRASQGPRATEDLTEPQRLSSVVGYRRIRLRFFCVFPLDSLERTLNGQYLWWFNAAFSDFDLSKPDNRGPSDYLRSSGSCGKFHSEYSASDWELHTQRSDACRISGSGQLFCHELLRWPVELSERTLRHRNFLRITRNWGFQMGFYLYLFAGPLTLVGLGFHRIFHQKTSTRETPQASGSTS